MNTNPEPKFQGPWRIGCSHPGCRQAGCYMVMYDEGDSSFFLCHDHATAEGAKAVFRDLAQRHHRNHDDDGVSDPHDSQTNRDIAAYYAQRSSAG